MGNDLIGQIICYYSFEQERYFNATVRKNSPGLTLLKWVPVHLLGYLCPNSLCQMISTLYVREMLADVLGFHVFSDSGSLHTRSAGGSLVVIFLSPLKLPADSVRKWQSTEPASQASGHRSPSSACHSMFRCPDPSANCGQGH